MTTLCKFKKREKGTRLFDERDDLLDALGTVARLAQNLNNAIGTARTANGINRDPRPRGLKKPLKINNNKFIKGNKI